MSYAYKPCRTAFTHGQLNRMYLSYDNDRTVIHNSTCGQGCSTDLNLTGQETATNSHQASNDITSTQIIAATANVTYTAGNGITLSPGFHAQSGCTFNASIVACKTGGNIKKQDNTPTHTPEYTVQPELKTNTVESSSIEEETALTVRPNPFQFTSTLSFDLKTDAEVNLSIYDLNGREIEQLAIGNLNKGIHEFVWQPNNLPSGIYLARLVYGNKIKTIRMVLGK